MKGAKKTTTQTTAPAVVLETVDTQIEKPTQALIAEPTFTPAMTPEHLQAMVKNETALRKIIEGYLKANMVNGTDFDRIHFAKDCANKWACTYEKNKGHFSKPSLLKPGAEKFASLFKLTARFMRDTETCEMAGNEPGLFCFKCELVDNNGRVVAEGRGACSSSEKYENMNNAIKIAQKRAQIDATLRYGSLSGVFTQDLEDAPPEVVASLSAPKAIPHEEQKPDFDRALVMIRGLENDKAVFAALERLKASKNFTPEQRKTLETALSRRLDEINNPST